MEIIQYIAVAAAVVFALWVLYKKFFPTKKSDDSCGSGNCGCS